MTRNISASDELKQRNDSLGESDETMEEQIDDFFEEDEELGDLLNQFEYSIHAINAKQFRRESDEIIRKSRVEEILRIETEFSIKLRSSLSTKMSNVKQIGQARDIEEAFAGTDYLRAELADLVPHTATRIFLIPKYINTSAIELRSRMRYKTIAMASALCEANNGESSEQWKLRIECDAKVVTATRELLSRGRKDLVLRKRREFDYNRAKAILRADILAMKAAW